MEVKLVHLPAPSATLLPTGAVEASRVAAAAATAAGGLLLAVTLHLVVFRRLRSAVRRGDGDGRDLVVRLVRDVVLSSVVLAGLSASVLILDLDPATERTAGRVLSALAIAAATGVGARAVAGLVRRSAARRLGAAPSTSIFVNLARFAVFALGALMVLQTFGVSIAPMLTALGVGGLAVALALQDTLADLFAGIHILASRKVQPGDFVSLDGTSEGYVEDVGWRNTSIRSLPDNLVLVPNARLAGATVVNYHRPGREMAVLVDVRVDPDSDLQHVEEVTVDVARKVLADVEGGVGDFDPFIRYHTFGESSVDFTAVLRAREFTDQYLLKHEFMKHLATRYAEEGIAMPLPRRVLQFADAGQLVSDRR